MRKKASGIELAEYKEVLKMHEVALRLNSPVKQPKAIRNSVRNSQSELEKAASIYKNIVSFDFESFFGMNRPINGHRSSTPLSTKNPQRRIYEKRPNSVVSGKRRNIAQQVSLIGDNPFKTPLQLKSS